MPEKEIWKLLEKEKGKEKFWMEDLVWLLNRYHSFPWFQYCYDGIDKRIYIQKNYPWFETQEEWVDNEWIISKRFGFIQRLVEQDKIDRDKIWFKKWLSWEYDNWIAFVHNYDNDTYKVSEFYSPYLQLLMLLSISDTPIEDLISYLK